MYFKNDIQISNTNKPHKLDLFYIAVLFFIFLGALNFIGRYYYCVFIAFFVFLVTPQRKIRIDFSLIILLALGISILIFSPSAQNSFTSMLKPFTYVICYIIGYSILDENFNMEDSNKTLTSVIYVIAAGTFFHFFVNMITNIGSQDRNTIDFWTNEAMSATGQASLVCITLGVIISFLFSNVGVKKK